MLKNAVRTLMMAMSIGATAPMIWAGADGGPKTTVTSVDAFGRDRFNWITFRAGEQAVVALKGDGDTDLDLYIYDGYGNLVAKDDDGLDLCIARWTPTYTSAYQIVVRNRGRVYNRYAMRTN